MRIKLTVQYKGTNYCGWQSQTNGLAVQDVVEKALWQYLNSEKPRLHCAGRTDVGVHSQGQVVHFDTEKKVNPYKLCLGLNTILPSDVSAAEAEIVPSDFDARFSAVSKTYRYKLYVSPTRNPLLSETHAQVYKPLDISKMKSAAQLLVGTHDFKCFRKQGSNIKGTVRTINSFDVIPQSDGTIHFVVNGNAFLYNMVRICVGTLVAVGKGKLTADDIEQMLSGNSRHIKTMPACGLTLEKVFY